MDRDNTRGTLKGAVYGDLVGAPYMIENTYNRYFELGESRKAYSHGRVRTFFPEVTEVSHACSAVARWLSVNRDNPTAENLQEMLRNAYDHHPRGGWTESTRLFLSSDVREPSQTSDWAAVVRVLPIAAFVRDDFFRAVELTEACVKATCANEESLTMAKAITQSADMALRGKIAPEIFTMLEHQYGLNLTWNEEDLRAELRGEVRVPLVMMGRTVEGAYRYTVPDSPVTPSAKVVTEAALMAVMRSDSWEDAVRRAVSYGGPSNAVAAIAGGLSEALYGEVTPSIVGKLFNHLPTDIAHQIESLDSSPQIRVSRHGSVFESMEKDAFEIISLGPGRTVYVVPEDRTDIRDVITGKVPDPKIITPSEVEGFLKGFPQTEEGTRPFAVKPERRILFLQNGEMLVSPSQYIAPGMPPLQERKRNLDEFLKLRAFCVEKQAEMNRLAGNEGAGQIHYGNAYHMWIGSRRIEFYSGEQMCECIRLDNRGLLKLDFEQQRLISSDARFENHHEQAWASRGVFSMEDSLCPMNRLQNIREAISYRLLDEGTGGENHELDIRYKDDDEKEQMHAVSNLDRLEKLDFEESCGIGVSPTDCGVPEGTEDPVRGKSQSTDRIFTIGYGNRTQEGFVNTLKMSGVDMVVDVRSIPRSRYVPHFNEDIIYDVLEAEGISYLSGGEKLGGRVTDLSLYDHGRVSWEKVAGSEEFQSGIASLEGLCEDGHIVAVVCSEGDPLSCHRFGLLSRALASDGMDVRHILPNGEVVRHDEMEARLVEKYTRLNKISLVCSGTYKEQLAEAYSIMNQERGYKPKEPLFRMGSYDYMKFKKR